MREAGSRGSAFACRRVVAGKKPNPARRSGAAHQSCPKNAASALESDDGDDVGGAVEARARVHASPHAGHATDSAASHRGRRNGRNRGGGVVVRHDLGACARLAARGADARARACAEDCASPCRFPSNLTPAVGCRCVHCALSGERRLCTFLWGLLRGVPGAHTHTRARAQLLYDGLFVVSSKRCAHAALGLVRSQGFGAFGAPPALTPLHRACTLVLDRTCARAESQRATETRRPKKKKKSDDDD